MTEYTLKIAVTFDKKNESKPSENEAKDFKQVDLSTKDRLTGLAAYAPWVASFIQLMLNSITGG